MRVDRFKAQVENAEKRYAANHDIRTERAKELKKLASKKDGGVDLSIIDDPARMVRRFKGVSKDPIAGEAMLRSALSATPDTTASLNLLERLIDENDLLSADFLTAGMRATRTVARVVIRSAGGNRLGYGSGFLVSPRLFMTNNHVLDTFLSAEASLLQFDYVETIRGESLAPIEFSFSPEEFFETDERLDFTLVAVEPENREGQRLADRGWSPLIEESGKALVGERVNILQHPGGEPQQLALRQNKIVDVPEDFLHYVADTERGSSGAPVFNDQWEVAALHHAGVPARDKKTNKILLVSGKPWNGVRDEIDQIKWIANEGTRISSIVAELKGRDFDEDERGILDQSFVQPEVAREASLPAVQSPSGATFDNGTVRWSMPIEFSVSIPSLAEKDTTTRTTRKRRRERETDRRSRLLDEFSQANIDRAKAAFALHKDDVYYDEAADEQRIIEYYADIEDSMVGEELYLALHHLVSSTHVNQFDYDTARYDHLYPIVDLREPPERSLASVYSEKGVDFEDVITSEAITQARHELSIQEFMNREGAFDEAKIVAHREFLESQDPFNCEHIVVQSWFGKRDPMKSDLHHLTTCEPGCNSSRNDNAYFDFDPDLTDFNAECGQVNKTESKFEPVKGKGLVARATLYYLIRYRNTITKPDRAQISDRLDTLLKWHLDEPVSLFEKHRNAEIHRIQGNRNPLIDFPFWAEHIPFELSEPS